MKTFLPLSAMSFTNISTPRACLEQPPMQLVASSPVQVSIKNVLGKPCEARLVFTDDNFLPVVFSFGRLPCMGTQVAAFDVPTEAPNGDAKCAGQSTPTCTKAVITNGTNSPELITSDQEGKIGCIQEASSLLTSLVTSISGSTRRVYDNAQHRDHRIIKSSTTRNNDQLSRGSESHFHRVIASDRFSA
ncbi:hypothetical protein PG993_006996 [Apiospora rasikravindrae]|uniref:Uncharacterized protein n=1 Tax=Apiospora rasikravindrae TaxID=990691 RepID=A0ABR1SY30_9PEZI